MIPPRRQGAKKIFYFFSELCVLCVFARVIFFVSPRSRFIPPPSSRRRSRRAKHDQSPIRPASPRAPPAPLLRSQRGARRSARRYPSDPRRQPRAPQSENLSPLLWRRARLFAYASSVPPSRRL